jgi:FkbM family methyltransferase
MDFRAAISRNVGVLRLLLRLRGSAERFNGRLVVRTSRAEHPVTCRIGSSDLLAFKQVFLDEQYRALPVREPRFIVDAGANVGCTAAYLLSCFPRAELLAVEPDPQSYELLCENLEPYGGRVMTLHAAVWPHAAGLVLDEKRYRDGSEWTHQFRPIRDGEAPSVPGLDLAALIALSGHEAVSLLKMDIEGAEALVFAEGYERWLGLVETIAIELHDDSQFGSASRAFAQALDGSDFAVSQAGELTIAVRQRARPAA